MLSLVSMVLTWQEINFRLWSKRERHLLKLFKTANPKMGMLLEYLLLHSPENLKDRRRKPIMHWLLNKKRSEEELMRLSTNKLLMLPKFSVFLPVKQSKRKLQKKLMPSFHPCTWKIYVYTNPFTYTYTWIDRKCTVLYIILHIHERYNAIYPVRNVRVRKIKVLQRPKLDNTKLAEIHENDKRQLGKGEKKPVRGDKKKREGEQQPQDEATNLLSREWLHKYIRLEINFFLCSKTTK